MQIRNKLELLEGSQPEKEVNSIKRITLQDNNNLNKFAAQTDQTNQKNENVKFDPQRANFFFKKGSTQETEFNKKSTTQNEKQSGRNSSKSSQESTNQHIDDQITKSINNLNLDDDEILDNQVKNRQTKPQLNPVLIQKIVQKVQIAKKPDVIQQKQPKQQQQQYQQQEFELKSIEQEQIQTEQPNKKKNKKALRNYISIEIDGDYSTNNYLNASEKININTPSSTDVSSGRRDFNNNSTGKFDSYSSLKQPLDYHSYIYYSANSNSTNINTTPHSNTTPYDLNMNSSCINFYYPVTNPTLSYNNTNSFPMLQQITPSMQQYNSMQSSFDSLNILNYSSTQSTSGSGSHKKLQPNTNRLRCKQIVGEDSNHNYDIDPNKVYTEGKTTIMIKNIPNKYNRNLLLNAIDKNHKGTYDFFYLPIDFKNKCNVGYAFINFIDPIFIKSFYEEFNGKKWEKFNSEKICEMKYARIQGRNALIQHFEQSSVMHQQDKKLKPLILPKNMLLNFEQLVQQQKEAGIYKDEKINFQNQEDE